MFPLEPGPKHTSFASTPARAPALAATVLLVAIVGMSTWLALKFDAMRPGVGDMIVFAPAPAEADSWRLHVAPAAVAGRDAAAGPCVFDPNELSATGGSLIVEARENVSPPRFRVHWAGKRTAKGPGDCGAAADLMLDRYELQRLANAAGGFGVKPAVLR